jgi:hypothetical protein
MAIATVHSKLGRCPKCMRLSLRVAVFTWAGAAAVHAAAVGDVLWYCSLAAAAGLTGLRFAHILAFGGRSLSAAGVAITASAHTDQIEGYAPSSRQRGVSRTRREMLWLFIRGTLVAATASLALTSPASARCGDCARSNGGGWHDCITHFCNTVGLACCPPGFPYLNHCNCLCYQSTSFNVPCSSYSNCNYCS